jgi:hypothetical protein
MPSFDWLALGEYNLGMQITKCDICKKQVIPHEDVLLRISILGERFNSFEICSECGKSITKFLKSKKLITDNKNGK